MSENTENEDGYFENKDGLKIARKYWKPELEEPRAMVFISHGLAEHCRVYAPVAKPLTDKGILVFSHDHVGHGKSDGERCNITTYDKYVQDVVKHVNMMKEKHPNCPVFIIGHSMGGLITLLTVQTHPDLFKGMVLIGPAIAPSPDSVSPVKIAMAKTLAFLSPKFIVTQLNPEFISRDPEVVKRYLEDPLNNLDGVRAKWATESIKAMNRVKKGMKETTLPWLSVHGDQDKMCEISGSELLHKDSGSDDKTFTVYKGCYHQIHYEPDGEGERCIQEITTWIDSHI